MFVIIVIAGQCLLVRLILSLLLFRIPELALNVLICDLTFHLCHEDFDGEVLVIVVVLFVFVCVVDHVFINVEYTTSVHEVSIEPAMEGKLLIVIELYPHIIVDKHIGTANGEVIVGITTNESHRRLLLFPPIVEDMAFADDFKVWENATFR